MREYLLTSRKGKKAETPARESDMPIVVMKQGNAIVTWSEGAGIAV